VPTRRERKTSTFEKPQKTSTGATKFKVRAFARSSRTMPKKSKNRCEGLCKRRFFTRTFKMAKTLPKPLPKTPLNLYSRRCFFVFLPKSAPRASQERPRSFQERPKSAPRAPKSAPERPKSAPRASQERPGALQERPRAPQEQKNTQKHAKTCNNLPNHKKTHENAQKLPKTIKNALPRPGWVSNAG